ncbi:MAG: pentapeptide repeat-containing protein [Acidobacteria bacterium]|nr:pentapeptide repeat-containing protein [Acidobacteriota bacterium]
MPPYQEQASQTTGTPFFQAEYADFSHSNIAGSKFVFADLSNANFFGASLIGFPAGDEVRTANDPITAEILSTDITNAVFSDIQHNREIIGRGNNTGKPVWVKPPAS